MGQTRVDLLHLLEDLRDAYPGSLEETLLTEIVANSLDSGARRIVLTADPAQSALLILDDGEGMKRAELARYHDVAASRKSRREGIGFAGVGIKLGLLASHEVMTETRRGARHFATRWHLASRHRAPWKWTPPAGLLSGHGTAVSLRLRNPLSPLLDAGFLEETLRRQFQPFFDLGFAETLATHYPGGVSFVINAVMLSPEASALSPRFPIALRLPRRRRASAFGFLWRSREDGPLPEHRLDQRGPPGLPPGRGVALRGIPHRSVGGDGSRDGRRRAERAARLHQRLPRALGRSTGPARQTPPTTTTSCLIPRSARTRSHAGR